MEKMKYLVTADIHSDAKAINTLIDIAEKENIDAVLIAGDLCPKNLDFMRLSEIRYIAVRGNSDFLWDYRDMELCIPKDYAILSLNENTHIAMTHGHLMSDASEIPYPLKKGDILITGHTHVPKLQEGRDGIIYLNPGSPSRPRSEDGPTYAVISDEAITLLSYPEGRILKKLSLEK